MKFLTKEDFKAVCDNATLAVIDQADEANLDRAELYSIEEISSYLRGRYDVAKAFSQTDSARNSLLVMTCCDVALYHLVAWLPKRIGFEIRETRYKRAIQWLESVQASKACPDLPILQDDKGEAVSPIKFGSWQKNNNEY